MSNFQSSVIQIESRAKAVGLSVSELCKAAEIDRATWQRWKAARVGPRLQSWMKVIEVVERSEKKARASKVKAA